MFDGSLTPHLVRLKYIFKQAQFEHRLKKGERGLSTLVLVRPVGVKTIATTARYRIVDWKVQVIASKEPIEGSSSLLVPLLISGNSTGFETGGYRCLRLYRLLI